MGHEIPTHQDALKGDENYFQNINMSVCTHLRSTGRQTVGLFPVVLKDLQKEKERGVTTDGFVNPALVIH